MKFKRNPIQRKIFSVAVGTGNQQELKQRVRKPKVTTVTGTTEFQFKVRELQDPLKLAQRREGKKKKKEGKGKGIQFIDSLKGEERNQLSFQRGSCHLGLKDRDSVGIITFADNNPSLAIHANTKRV